MLNNKRILIFSTAYLPWVGGAEIAIKEITDRNIDIHFDLITVNLSGQEYAVEKVGNVVVHRLGAGPRSKFFLPITGLRKALELHKKQPYDAIWGMMASQASVAASFFKKFRLNVPFILTLQEGDEETYLKRYVFGSELLYNLFVRPFYRMPIRNANHITAISNYLKERAVRAGARAPITIIPNGVDANAFGRTLNESEIWTLKTALNKTTDEKFIITTSRLVQKNGVGDLIMALTYVPANFRLLILGVGDLQAELERKVEKEKLAGRVSFLGYVPHHDIPKYLRVSDIFARPSLSEGMGNSFIEAMAAGVPVIGTPVGGIPDFLKDGVTGVICQPENPKSIAAAITKLFPNSEAGNEGVHQAESAAATLRATIIKNARALVAEKYDWNIIAESMKKVFQDA